MNTTREFIITLPSNAPAGPYTATNTPANFTIPLDIHAIELSGEWEVSLFDFIAPNLSRVPPPITIETLELTAQDRRRSSDKSMLGSLDKTKGSSITVAYASDETSASLAAKLNETLPEGMSAVAIDDNDDSNKNEIKVEIESKRLDHDVEQEQIAALKRTVDRPRMFGYNVPQLTTPSRSTAGIFDISGPEIESLDDLTHRIHTKRDPTGIDHIMPREKLTYSLVIDKSKFYYDIDDNGDVAAAAAAATPPSSPSTVRASSPPPPPPPTPAVPRTQAQARTGGHLVVVTCNIVDPNAVIFASTTLPCLRVLPLSLATSQVNTTGPVTVVQYPIKGLLWLPVSVSRLDAVNIALRDELGEPLALPPAHLKLSVQVTLKFRRVR